MPAFAQFGAEIVIDSNIVSTSDIKTTDINNDGFINVVDVVQLVNIILNNEEEDSADLNNDNIVNVLDIITLVNLILQ